MSRILIVYGTTDGHTGKVVDALKKTFMSEGCEVEAVEAKYAQAENRPEAFDAVLVAASIHAGRYQREVRRWVGFHAEPLSRKPNAFLSVCLAVLEKRPEALTDLARIEKDLIEETGWAPVMMARVAGAILYTRYGWLKKWLMKRISARAGGGTDTSRDYDYTDWAALEKFGREFITRNRLGRLRAV